MQATSYGTPGTAGGNREDLRDILTILEPEQFPFTSMVKKINEAAATLNEVTADSLRKPRTTGTREGQDQGKGNNKVTGRKRFGVYQHRVMDEYGVSDVQQAISKRGGVAAVANEFANDKAKTLRELKRDIEAICCSNNDHLGGDENEMRTRGVFKWLQPSGTATFTAPVVPDAFLPLATSATGTTTVSAIKTLGAAASASTFNEDDQNLICRALNRQHGKRTFDAIYGDSLIDVVDHFTRTNKDTTNSRYQVTEMADEHEITMMVKVFESSQARLNFIPTQFNFVNSSGDPDSSAGMIIAPELWFLDFLEELYSEDGPKTAGGQNGYAKAMFSLNCKLPRGNGKIVQ